MSKTFDILQFLVSRCSFWTVGQMPNIMPILRSCQMSYGLYWLTYLMTDGKNIAFLTVAVHFLVIWRWMVDPIETLVYLLSPGRDARPLVLIIPFPHSINSLVPIFILLQAKRGEIRVKCLAHTRTQCSASASVLIIIPKCLLRLCLYQSEKVF